MLSILHGNSIHWITMSLDRTRTFRRLGGVVVAGHGSLTDFSFFLQEMVWVTPPDLSVVLIFWSVLTFPALFETRSYFQSEPRGGRGGRTWGILPYSSCRLEVAWNCDIIRAAEQLAGQPCLRAPGASNPVSRCPLKASRRMCKFSLAWSDISFAICTSMRTGTLQCFSPKSHVTLLYLRHTALCESHKQRKCLVLFIWILSAYLLWKKHQNFLQEVTDTLLDD